MATSKKTATPSAMENCRIYNKYKSEVASSLQKEFGYKNVNEIPKLVKITMNSGFGSIKDNPKSVQTAIAEMEAIVGQKVVPTRAKKSVANFKLREGMTIGAKVDLRGERMFQFLDRFVSIALPRIRDFKGISGKGFDGRGNYTVGIKEQLIFPEISYEKVEKTNGFDITFVTTAKTDAEAKALLKGLGMPFNS